MTKRVEGLWEVTRYTDAQMPPEWGLLAGDAIHNARSALDHLVCARVEALNEIVTIAPVPRLRP